MTCRHERQEWRGQSLPCADFTCNEGVEGRALVLVDTRGEQQTFDRAVFVSGVVEVAGRRLKKPCEARSVVWVRRGGPFKPRRE